MTEKMDAITFARAEEQLRQEREAFDQKKKQDGIWFYLRFATGVVSLLLLLVIVPICFYIFVHHGEFPDIVVTAASAALFGDVVGLVVLVAKVMVGSGQVRPLEPVTRALSDKAVPSSKRRDTEALEHSAANETL